MAKNTVTRKSALAYALALIDYANTEAITLPNFEDVDKLGSAETLANMLEQVSKPRKAAVSKARKMNENLAAEIAKVLPAEGLTSKGIVGLGFPEVTTTQKAVAVMRVAEELELVERLKDGKTITFKPIASEGEEE